MEEAAHSLQIKLTRLTFSLYCNSESLLAPPTSLLYFLSGLHTNALNKYAWIAQRMHYPQVT